MFAGVRLWAIEWDIASLEVVRVAGADGSGAAFDRGVVQERASDTELATIPTIGLRYGNFVGTFSYMLPTSFDSKGAFSRDVKRKEWDLTFGYHIRPNLVLSLAYKEAEVDRLVDAPGDSRQKVKGVLIGLSGTSPLSDKWSLYGNFAYGVSRQESDFSNDDFSGNYKIGEIGLAHRLYVGDSSSFLKGLTATIGYRAQSYTIEDIELPTYLANTLEVVSIQKRDSRTSTTGVVIGLVGVF